MPRHRRPHAVSVALLAPVLVVLALVAGGCGGRGNAADGASDASTEAPDLGACRMLDTSDLDAASNASPVVDCKADHDAQTFAVGALPARFDHAAYDDPALGSYAYDACTRRFIRFTGADESLAMRTILTWAWFRPSETAWDHGARWYRCDVVGGGEQTKGLIDLPRTAKGLLLGQPADQWMVCAVGPSVSGSVKVPCNQKHTWRAVSTIKVGEPGDPYPGDHAVEVKTRQFCSDQVGAYLGYPVDYDYGYSWFHQAEWKAGNRRSVCWARTES